MNVLGDAFGTGIVYHYSKKQLGSPPPVESTDNMAISPVLRGKNTDITGSHEVLLSDSESIESSPLYKVPESQKEETDL